MRMQHEKKRELYGSKANRMAHLMHLAESANEIDPTWQAGGLINRLAPEFVQLLDEIYNVIDWSLRPINSKFDHLTEKFDFASPASHESFINESEFLEHMISCFFQKRDLSPKP